MAIRRDNVLPFRRAKRFTRARDYGAKERPWWRRVSPIMVMLPLGAFTGVFLFGGPPAALGWPGDKEDTPAVVEQPSQRLWSTTPEALDAAQPRIVGSPADGAADRDGGTMRFGFCGGGYNDNCVIDGDTFRYGGEKIRIADINTS